jgi:hypothetical protein
MVTIVTLAVLLAGWWGLAIWANRPENVGPQLCHREAELAIQRANAALADPTVPHSLLAGAGVADTASVVQQSDGTYLIGLTIVRPGKEYFPTVPMQCTLMSVDGVWRTDGIHRS